MPPRARRLYDGWELDEQLRHIERVLISNKLRGDSAAAVEPDTVRRDHSHAGPPAWHAHPASKPARRPVQRRPARRGWALGLLLGIVLLLGITAVLGGGAVAGWSMWMGRQDVWAFAAPTALAGQVLLLIGLVLQLHRLGRNSRFAAGKLEKLDQELHDLRATTTLLEHDARPVRRGLLRPSCRRRQPADPVERLKEPVGHSGDEARVGRSGRGLAKPQANGTSSGGKQRPRPQ